MPESDDDRLIEKFAKRNQRGVALLAVASAAAVHRHERYATAARRAEQAAESGVHHILAQIEGKPGAREELLAKGTVSGILLGSEESENAVSYSATLESGASDGADNDRDGAVDEADEAQSIEVACTGSADNVRKTVYVTIMRELVGFSSNGAVYIHDPNMEIDFDDDPSTGISGIDVDLAGNPTGLLVPGIGVAGDPAHILSQFPAGKLNDVVGLGGAASIHQVTPISSIDHLLALADSAPAVNLSDTSVTYPGIVNIRTGDEVEIEGTVRGAGVLVIDGEFEIDEGTLIWDGLVIVRGGGEGEEAEIEEGKLKVTGGIVFLGNSVEELEFEESTTIVQYSQAMLNRVVPPVPTPYRVIRWRDGPNPEESD
jgi:hypothetical protein